MRIRRWSGGLIRIALAAVVLSIISASGSGFEAVDNSRAASPPKPKPIPTWIDRHAYPRTYLIWNTGPLQELARYDMIVGSQSVNAAGLRVLNPNGVFLFQPNVRGSYIHVTAPGGAFGWPGATDSLPGGKQLGSIRAVNADSDLLHNADGSFARAGNILGWNLAAAPSAGVPDEVAKVFAYTAKLGGLFSCKVRVGPPGKKKAVACWNGVHSDNWLYSAIGAGWFYGPNIDANRDGKVDDEDVLRQQWSNGLTRVGMLLRSYLPGMIVGGNGAWYQSNVYTGPDPNGWLKASNYTMIEHAQNYSAETLLTTAKKWLTFRDPLGQPRYLAMLQDATGPDGKVLIWRQSDPNTVAAMTRPDVLRSMRWGLTLSLMTGAYYELIGDFYGNPYVCRWWFDEYDGGVGIRKRGYLGQPLGAYKKLAAGVYRRDFQHGVALNNSSSDAKTINLGGTFRKLKGTQDPTLNDGSTVTSVTIPPRDGLVLVRQS